MPRRPSITIGCLVSLTPAALALLSALPSEAVTVVVPDDYPTIQAAINSTADRILVRDGTYPENLAIERWLSLEPVPHSFDGDFDPPADAHPLILGSIEMRCGSVLGLHVSGGVSIVPGPCDVAIRECRVDSGIVGGQPFILGIRGCIVRGGINVRAWYGDITTNTVLGGGIYFLAEGCCGEVRGNYVVGPAATGIVLRTFGTRGGVSGNTVLGCGTGIALSSWDPQPVKDNTVTGCQGTGIHISTGGNPQPATVGGNLIQQCGGHGLELKHVGGTVDGNTVLDVGGCGVWVDREGGEGEDRSSMLLQGNRVLRSGSDGIHFDHVGEVTGNIVGRAAGRGIVVLPPGTAINVYGNTSYWNARAGLDVSSEAAGTIANNIAYGNQREGLVWSGTGSPPTLACNDWYANVSGATSGLPPGATDLAVDPYFCNVPQDDVHLAVFSPLRNAPGCGLVGALDAGCSEPTAVADMSRSSAQFACTPRPTTGDLRFSWPGLEASGRLEVFDAAGARRWQRSVEKGSEGLDWNATDDSGRRLPAGIYFARLSAGSLRATTRVVVLE